MAFQNSRSEYAARMHRVLEHIDRHLDEALDLVTLAEVAHFSPYHFHRLFTAWMGETVGEYMRRRRLELAAMRLTSQPRLSILQLALASGFTSPEAFARAFRQRFQCSPSQWRTRQRGGEHSNPDQVKRNPDQAPSALPAHTMTFQPKHEEVIMDVKIIDRPEVTVAYLRYQGPYGPGLTEFWTKVYYPWANTHGLLNRARYGISHDDPDVVAPEQCRYDACVEVDKDYQPQGGAFKTVIPGGRYAVLTFEGPIYKIGAAWTSLMRDWLPGSGFQIDARPCFEYYPADAVYDPITCALRCDICIPVAPL